MKKFSSLLQFKIYNVKRDKLQSIQPRYSNV